MGSEGIGFLTKTLPRLGKAFDKALSLHSPLNATELGLAAIHGSKLPRFLGELFSAVLDPTGVPLPEARADIVAAVRQLTYCFYKYELPYSTDQEQGVINKFLQTELDMAPLTRKLQTLSAAALARTHLPLNSGDVSVQVLRKARILLERVFSGLTLTDIVPRHGPGAVATRQQLQEKYLWTNVSSNITRMFPLDEFFFASQGHVCDAYRSFERIGSKDLPARVILVPKDSRGPRLISCEPVDYQWIQQGIMAKLVRHVETLPLTRFNIHFTDQGPNRCGAQLGSLRGKYATLDLNEASDRVSLSLVRALFPPHIVEVLESARTSATQLPDGRVVKLQKFAPMGSALCFPILALTVWSLLTAAARDRDARESILVYGDDVIVPTQNALNAIETLESFGLKINRDKSCTNGLFRESCGMDAFKGSDVTPVRFRTVWSSKPSPEVYSSWIAYANSLYDRKHFNAYDTICSWLFQVYGRIPSDDMHLQCPSLREVPETNRPIRSRTNPRLQRREYRVRAVRSSPVRRDMPGWSKLLRFFTEAGRSKPLDTPHWQELNWSEQLEAPFSVHQYTKRRVSMLTWCWR